MLIPSEVLQNVFSFLPYTETYRFRSVSTGWKVECEYHIYSQLKSRCQKLSIKIGEKNDTTVIDMIPDKCDYKNQVIEFKTCSEEQEVFISPSTNSRGRMQILYSDWKDKPFNNVGAIRDLNLADRALSLFHLRYNPSLEQIYRIPSPSLRRSNNGRLRYVGDQGMVMCFSYLDPTTDETNVQIPEEDNTNAGFIRIKVHYIHVTISWILAGMNIGVTPQPLYPNRYEALEQLLDVYDIQDYPLYSEPVLEYIMRCEFKDNRSKNGEQSVVVILPIHEKKSNLEILQHKLQILGIDPRFIWKYSFAKSFILSGGNVEDVVKVIQKSEEEWKLKSSAILSQLKKK
ncbi:unnamed protein product [Mucor hiemalis]